MSQAYNEDQEKRLAEEAKAYDEDQILQIIPRLSTVCDYLEKARKINMDWEVNHQIVYALEDIESIIATLKKWKKR